MKLPFNGIKKAIENNDYVRRKITTDKPEPVVVKREA